jgi:hypothetical protein
VKIISKNFHPLFEKSSWPLFSPKKTLISLLPFGMEVAEKTDSRKLWSPCVRNWVETNSSTSSEVLGT